MKKPIQQHDQRHNSQPFTATYSSSLNVGVSVASCDPLFFFLDEPPLVTGAGNRGVSSPAAAGDAPGAVARTGVTSSSMVLRRRLGYGAGVEEQTGEGVDVERAASVGGRVDTGRWLAAAANLATDTDHTCTGYCKLL